MRTLSHQRSLLALRLAAAILVLGLANRLRAQESGPPMEIRRAEVLNEVNAAPTPPPSASVTDSPPPALDAAQPAGDSPVPRPALQHFAKLWTESLFTTRALPAPEAPKGPTFADNLSLSGTYELNGKMVAILIDKTTSSVMEAYNGEDNESGIRIVKVEPGASSDSMKLQLQKGTEVGWIRFADANTTSEQQMARPEALGAPMAPPAQGMPQVPPPAPQPVPMPQAAPMPQTAPPPAQPQFQLNAGMPQAAPALPDDVPLPPP